MDHEESENRKGRNVEDTHIQIQVVDGVQNSDKNDPNDESDRREDAMDMQTEADPAIHSTRSTRSTGCFAQLVHACGCASAEDVENSEDIELPYDWRTQLHGRNVLMFNGRLIFGPPEEYV
jgi:hypothetical protein